MSPFNSTQKFLNGEYFLTHQQDDVKNKIFEIIDKKDQANFISLTGSAGTGKTLLSYDIMKNVKERGNKTLIVHCGQLNSGQEILNSSGWEIIPIKNIKDFEISEFDLILVDEAQRIYSSQLDDIFETASKNNGNCLFSYDREQTLSATEDRAKSSDKIESLSNNVYNLTEKIRSNKEIANFIKSLLNKRLSSNGNTPIFSGGLK